MMVELTEGVGLTTVPYTTMAVQNMVLYRYGPYNKRAILTKFKLMTVQRWLQMAVLWCFMVVQANFLFKTVHMQVNYTVLT